MIDPVYPTSFYIETVLGCNLTCAECALGSGLINRTQKVMRFDEYKILANKIRPHARVVYPFAWGEPFLNPDIIQIIKYTKEFARVKLATNGLCITDGFATELMATGVDMIDIALDAASARRYACLRRGGDFHKVVANVKKLVAANKGTKLFGQFIVFKHNEDEIGDFRFLCNALGIIPKFVKPLFFTSTLKRPANVAWHRPLRSVEDARDELRRCEGRCRMIVYANGSVVPCCFDYNGTQVFGNLFAQEVSEIWNSAAYKEFRKALYGTDEPPELCLSCPRLWPTQE